jgi:hypothetical protein
MRNLAGVDPVDASQTARAELLAAGVPVAEHPDDGRQEVAVSCAGLLRMGDGRVATFRRLWCYWSVCVEPPLSVADACAINERPHAGDLDAGRSHYSGNSATLGAVARAFGYAGGMDRPMLERWCAPDGCDGWHVDTQAGLAALVAALIARGGGGAAAEEDRVDG